MLSDGHDVSSRRQRQSHVPRHRPPLSAVYTNSNGIETGDSVTSNRVAMCDLLLPEDARRPKLLTGNLPCPFGRRRYMPTSVRLTSPSNQNAPMHQLARSSTRDKNSLPEATVGITNSSKLYDGDEVLADLLRTKAVSILASPASPTQAHHPRPPSRNWSQILASLGIGIFIGAVITRTRNTTSQTSCNDVGHTTPNHLINGSLASPPLPSAEALRAAREANNHNSVVDNTRNNGNQIAYRGWLRPTDTPGRSTIGTFPRTGASGSQKTGGIQDLKRQRGDPSPGGIDKLRWVLGSQAPEETSLITPPQPETRLTWQDTPLLKNSLTYKISRHYPPSTMRRECLDALTRLSPDVANSPNEMIRSVKFQIFSNLYDNSIREIESNHKISKIKSLIDDATTEMQLASANAANTESALSGESNSGLT